jgi:glycosyltransferase involved in cell wall biosynthesis
MTGPRVSGASRLLIQRVIPAYKVALLRRLADDLDLTVLHAKEQRGSEVADTAAPPFSHRMVGRLYAPGSRNVVWLGVLRHVLRDRPETVIVEGSVGILSNYALLVLRPFLGFSLIAWTFGFDPSTGLHAKGVKDRLRLWFYRRCDALILYWDTGADAVVDAAADLKDRVFVARNVVGSADVEPHWTRLRAEGREAVKQRLGVPAGEPLVSFVGRLVAVKRADAMIDAFSEAHRALGCGRLAVIGSGPERVALEKRVDGLGLGHGVRFLGELGPADTAEWLYASDLVMVPGRLGLVVSHAAGFGAPVLSIAEAGAFHGEGAEFLVDAVTGAWCSGPSDLAERAIALLGDRDGLDRLHVAARAFYEKELSESRTVEGFRDAIAYAKRARAGTEAVKTDG